MKIVEKQSWLKVASDKMEVMPFQVVHQGHLEWRHSHLNEWDDY